MPEKRELEIKGPVKLESEVMVLCYIVEILHYVEGQLV